MGDNAEAAYAYLCHGVVLSQHGEVDQGLEELVIAAELADRAHDLRRLGWAHFDIADLERLRQRLPEAEKHNQTARELLEGIGDRFGLGQTYLNEGKLHLLAGELDLATQALNQAAQLFREERLPGDEVEVVMRLAEVDLARGELAAAREKSKTSIDGRFRVCVPTCSRITGDWNGRSSNGRANVSPPRRRAPRRRASRPERPLCCAGRSRRSRWTRDVTTRAILPHRLPGRAQVIAQGSGVLSGLEAARALAVNRRPASAASLSDGAAVRSGTVVLELSGDLRRILAVERTMLNFLMHLYRSGHDDGGGGEKARRARPGFRIRATRKTLPGLRDLEKAAVVHGGGESIDRDLSDAVLIKSTRLAWYRWKRRSTGRRARAPGDLQVEVRSLAQARTAVTPAPGVCLSTMRSPATVARIVRGVHRARGGRTIEVEVSGGIGQETIAAYARTGADAASLGRLTHSAPAIPFHLTFGPRRRSSPR